MQIQVRTGHNIDGSDGLTEHVENVIEHALSHFSDSITRVEVHLTAETADKAGRDDKTCTIEVRVKGRQPAAVKHRAGSVHEAVDGAAEKAKHLIEHTLGKLEDRR